MSLTYTTYGNTLVAMMAGSPTDANYLTVLPSIIDYAEARIYRELDLLATVKRDSSGVLTANQRTATLPTAEGRFVVVSAVNLLAVGGATRIKSLRPVSLEFLDAAFPLVQSTSASAQPDYFAMVDDTTIAIGPSPGANFGFEVVGTIRPAALSASNATTYLTDHLPELFLAASMVYAAAYQRNFGAQSDDPKMAASWEQQFQTLLASADREESRKKFASVSWTSKRAEPGAVAQRG
jgi:hypothetical protein